MSHILSSQPIPRMRLIQEGSMPAYMAGGGVSGPGPGRNLAVRDEFLSSATASCQNTDRQNIAGSLSQSQSVTLMHTGIPSSLSGTAGSVSTVKPVATISKSAKGKRAAGVSPAGSKAVAPKKRKSMTVAPSQINGKSPSSAVKLPPLPPGGVGDRRPPTANCKYRNSFPLTTQPQPQQTQPPPPRRRRTVEDFVTFCRLVLEYENYPDLEEDRKRHSSSPLGSTGSSSGSGWEPGPPPPHSSTSVASSNVKVPHDVKPEINHNANAVAVSVKKHQVQNPAAMTPVRQPRSPTLNSSPDHDHDTEDTSAIDDDDDEDDMEGEDGWNSVTCFCRKPFAGRPMIECTGCLVWVHLKCAKLNRRKIPDEWFCANCRQDPFLASPPQPRNAPTPTSTSSAKTGQKAQKGAANRKSAQSPSKPAGARKRKSSLTSKRVVVITNSTPSRTAEDTSSSSPDMRHGADQVRRTSAAEGSASGSVTPSGDSNLNCESNSHGYRGRGEWQLPKRQDEDS